MIIYRCPYQNLKAVDNGFYQKSEVEFLGREIDFEFMTPSQLNVAIAESITLYNQLYPPPEKKGFAKVMNTAIKVGIIAGVGVMTGGAVLAAYGVQTATVMSALGTAATKTGVTMATIQKGATAVGVAGKVYGKVTGDTPEELIKASELIKSDNALDAMEFIAKDQLQKKGMEIQAGNDEANAALREKLKKEQALLSEKMVKAADQKAAELGQPTPQKKKVSGIEVAALATPFLLYFMR